MLDEIFELHLFKHSLYNLGKKSAIAITPVSWWMALIAAMDQVDRSISCYKYMLQLAVAIQFWCMDNNSIGILVKGVPYFLYCSGQEVKSNTVLNFYLKKWLVWLECKWQLHACFLKSTSRCWWWRVINITCWRFLCPCWIGK